MFIFCISISNILFLQVYIIPDTLSIMNKCLGVLFICNAFLHEEHFLVDPLLDHDRFTSDQESVSSLDRSVRVQEYTFL